jgi:hypothetical protein
MLVTHFLTCWVKGSHSGDYEEFCILVYNAL